jgi:hypothetical protein
MRDDGLELDHAGLSARKVFAYLRLSSFPEVISSPRAHIRVSNVVKDVLRIQSQRLDIAKEHAAALSPESESACLPCDCSQDSILLVVDSTRSDEHHQSIL